MKKYALTGSRKCIHNVQKRSYEQRKDKSVGKNTQCGSKLTFKLRNTTEHNHSLDCDLFPLEFSINYNHNHSVYSASAFKFHSVSQSTKQKFDELFEAGNSPGSAYRIYRDMLRLEHGSNYVKISADRKLLPTYGWVFKAFSNYIQQSYGKINSIDAFRKAEERVRKYNDKNNDELATIHQTDEGEFFVCVCDNLSKRTHEMLPQAGDIVFLDSTGSLDRQDSRFFRFLTCSPCGGLPLGYVITSNETEELLTKAFEKFKILLPNYAFYKRAELGPHCFLTDDCDAEINSLR